MFGVDGICLERTGAVRKFGGGNLRKKVQSDVDMFHNLSFSVAFCFSCRSEIEGAYGRENVIVAHQREPLQDTDFIASKGNR